MILFKIILYKMNKIAIVFGSTKAKGKSIAALLGKEKFNIVVFSKSQMMLIKLLKI